jgi:hypothetical protein
MFDEKPYSPGNGKTTIHFRAPLALAEELDRIVGKDEPARADFLIHAVTEAIAKAKRPA